MSGTFSACMSGTCQYVLCMAGTCMYVVCLLQCHCMPACLVAGLGSPDRLFVGIITQPACPCNHHLDYISSKPRGCLTVCGAAWCKRMWCSLVQPGARECGAAWCSLVQENVLPSAPLCAAWCNIMFHYNCHSCTHKPCVVSRSNTAYTWHSGFPEVCPGQVTQMGGPCPGRQQVDMEAMGDA